MNGPFKVGEICIGQNFVIEPEYNDVECVIQKRLARGIYFSLNGELLIGQFYIVEFSDGDVSVVRPNKLRRKPPKQDLTEWANAKIAQLTKPVEQPVKECA